MRWTAFIVAGWAVLAGLVIVQKSMPAAWWMDVGSVDVVGVDAPDGCLPMEVEREINREFFAEWTVTIMRQNGGGGYYTYQTFRGANDYRPENNLPDDLNLCWWAWTDSIAFLPGNYRVHTLWKLHVDGGTREVRRKTRPFEIH